MRVDAEQSAADTHARLRRAGTSPDGAPDGGGPAGGGPLGGRGGGARGDREGHGRDAAAQDATAVFEQHRGVLMGVAYRMLGSVADAEDVVQDAWLRWQSAGRDGVREPRAYLVRVATRLAVDRLRAAQRRRETYVGPWLPEPLVTHAGTGPERGGTEPDAAQSVLAAESVSFALLVVMESLSPLERAVFVLREAFGFPYAEIAAALDRSEAAVRQLGGRARAHVAERRPRFDVDPEARRDLTERFLAAATRGDLAALMEMLAPDARLLGDGGGKAKAPMRAITTADKVGRFAEAIARRGLAARDFRLVEVNGGPALLATEQGVPTAVLQIDVAGGRIQSVYIVANPDKLTRLTP
ncbi:RNA polymerase sigma-70 factor, ECF subfamily [Streptomyces sp. WMMB 714]|nr:RNA polymerase sigma-70 factor, ECF subfamily [Streptomyces sp. WMMB 714]